MRHGKGRFREIWVGSAVTGIGGAARGKLGREKEGRKESCECAAGSEKRDGGRSFKVGCFERLTEYAEVRIPRSGNAKPEGGIHRWTIIRYWTNVIQCLLMGQT